MDSNLEMRLHSFQPLFKLLQGLALGTIMLANPLSAQADPVGNNKITQQQVNDSSTIKILADKALALQKEGKYKEAAEHWERFIGIVEKNFGPFYLDLVPSLNLLGDLYHLQDEYSKAESLYIRSLAITEKALGPDHPDVATSLNNLALLYDNQGKYSKAEPLYVRALRIKEKALGPEHPDVATSLNNLAGIYKVQGKLSKAKPLLTWKPSCENEQSRNDLVRSSSLKIEDKMLMTNLRSPRGGMLASPRMRLVERAF